MTYYVAIIEDAGPDHAVGVWFPDLPGCFAAGDMLDEALLNAPEAIALWIEAQGGPAPRARTPSELRSDPETSADMATHAIALIPAPSLSLQPAAEQKRFILTVPMIKLGWQVFGEITPKPPGATRIYLTKDL